MTFSIYSLLSTTASETTEMEDLRKIVFKLQENIKKIEVTEEAMKDVINCYTKHVEALKRYTLGINERVGVIEDTLKGNNSSVDDLIIEKVERVKEDLANLDEKIDSVEDKLVEDMENNKARIDVLSNSIEHHKEESRKLLELMKENEIKLLEVEKKL